MDLVVSDVIELKILSMHFNFHEKSRGGVPIYQEGEKPEIFLSPITGGI